MTGIRLKNMLLYLAAMTLLIGLSGAQVDESTHLTVFINEHVSLSANPGTSGGDYFYKWTAVTQNWQVTENGIAVNMALSQNPLIFDAPSTAGDYTLKVLVSDKKAPDNCKAEKIIILHVKKCCPILLADYCVDDNPVWCWYDSCGTPTNWNPGWVIEPSSIVFKWYVPSDAANPVYTGPCYTPDLGSAPFAIPDTTTPSKQNSVRLDVTQTTSAHPGSSSLLLYSCPLTFNLHLVPVPSVSLSTT